MVHQTSAEKGPWERGKWARQRNDRKSTAIQSSGCCQVLVTCLPCRAAIDRQAALSPADAVAEYVELTTGQHGLRLEVLLARTGLNGHDPTTGVEAGRRLGVSYQRIHQLEQQL